MKLRERWRVRRGNEIKENERIHILTHLVNESTVIITIYSKFVVNIWLNCIFGPLTI